MIETPPLVSSGDPLMAGSPAQAILQALVCARRDDFTDALAHAVRAREQVDGSQSRLVTMLDAFIDCQSRYHDAQRDLHEASRRFAAVSAEQQEQIARLEAVLPRVALESDDEPPAAPPPRGEPAPHEQPNREQSPPSGASAHLPPLSITCFGQFTVWREDKRVQLCQNRNGQAILRYLAAHPRHRETIDNLMDVLWPDDEPEVARHKLHVAISALRRALNGDFERQKGVGYLLCEGGVYGLNLDTGIRIDAVEFQESFRAGQRSTGEAAVAHFEAACRLYSGTFLPEDLYAEWSAVLREQHLLTYLAMCSTIATHRLLGGSYAEAERWATAVLAENRCDEEAHRQIMRAYAAQNRRSDVLRQYRRCEQALRDELGVTPMPETTALFEAVLRGEALPEQGETESRCA